MIYLTLFGVGNIIFGGLREGLLLLGIAAVAAAWVYADLNRRGRFDTT